MILGYYADIAARCQVFRICANTANDTGKGFGFLCPNGTLFNQEYFVCDWYMSVNCENSEKFYHLNDQIGQNMAQFSYKEIVSSARDAIMFPMTGTAQAQGKETKDIYRNYPKPLSNIIGIGESGGVGRGGQKQKDTRQKEIQSKSDFDNSSGSKLKEQSRILSQGAAPGPQVFVNSLGQLSTDSDSGFDPRYSFVIKPNSDSNFELDFPLVNHHLSPTPSPSHAIKTIDIPGSLFVPSSDRRKDSVRGSQKQIYTYPNNIVIDRDGSSSSQPNLQDLIANRFKPHKQYGPPIPANIIQTPVTNSDVRTTSNARPGTQQYQTVQNQYPSNRNRVSPQVQRTQVQGQGSPVSHHSLQSPQRVAPKVQPQQSHQTQSHRVSESQAQQGPKVYNAAQNPSSKGQGTHTAFQQQLNVRPSSNTRAQANPNVQTQGGTQNFAPFQNAQQQHQNQLSSNTRGQVNPNVQTHGGTQNFAPFQNTQQHQPVRTQSNLKSTVQQSSNVQSNRQQTQLKQTQNSRIASQQISGNQPKVVENVHPIQHQTNSQQSIQHGGQQSLQKRPTGVSGSVRSEQSHGQGGSRFGTDVQVHESQQQKIPLNSGITSIFDNFRVIHHNKMKLIDLIQQLFHPPSTKTRVTNAEIIHSPTLAEYTSPIETEQLDVRGDFLANEASYAVQEGSSRTEQQQLPHSYNRCNN
jgi:hypothetical protein